MGIAHCRASSGALVFCTGPSSSLTDTRVTVTRDCGTGLKDFSIVEARTLVWFDASLIVENQADWAFATGPNRPIARARQRGDVVQRGALWLALGYVVRTDLICWTDEIRAAARVTT